jgi:hypothetical protein
MRFKLSFVLAFLVLEPTVLADSELDTAKKTYGFASWPGKDGALRQGVALREVDLSLYEEHSTRNRLTTTGEMIVRYSEKTGTQPAFEVAVRVFDSVHEAQTHLLSFLNGSTMDLTRGEKLGLSVGDVSFATKAGATFNLIAFTRSNVSIRIATYKKPFGDTATYPDIVPVATKIDARILSEAVAKKAKHLKKPRIAKFSALKPVTKPDGPVRLLLKVTDPRNEHVEIHFDEGGGMVYEHEGLRYFKAEKPLEYTVTVHAVNEHFLISKKSLTIRVET